MRGDNRNAYTPFNYKFFRNESVKKKMKIMKVQECDNGGQLITAMRIPDNFKSYHAISSANKENITAIR